MGKKLTNTSRISPKVEEEVKERFEGRRYYQKNQVKKRASPFFLVTISYSGYPNLKLDGW